MSLTKFPVREAYMCYNDLINELDLLSEEELDSLRYLLFRETMDKQSQWRESLSEFIRYTEIGQFNFSERGKKNEK